MNRLLRLGAVAVLVAASGPVGAAPAGKEVPTAPLDASFGLVPAKAAIVIHINGFERARGRLDKMLTIALPDKAPQISQQLTQGLASILQGRDLKGLRADGHVYVALSDLDKLPDDANFTFLFPISSTDDFKKSFLTDDERKSIAKDGDFETFKMEERENPFYLVPLKGYVAACSDKSVAAQVAAGTAGGLEKVMSRETARSFVEADLSVFVNVKEINAKFGDKLKGFKFLAEAFLGGAGVQGISKAQMDQFKAVMDGAFQVLEDGVGVVLGIDFRPEGLNIRGLAQFGEKTGTNEALKASQSAALVELGTLPGGQLAYTASALHLGGSKSAGLMLGAMAASDPDAKVQTALDAALKEIAGADQGVTLTAGTAIGGAGIEITPSKAAAGLAAAKIKLMQSLAATSSFSNVPLKGKPTVKEKAEKLGSFELAAVTVSFDIDKAIAEIPDEAKEITKTSMLKALGGDTQHLWIGTDGKIVIQLTGKDWAEARALAEAYLETGKAIGKDEAFVATRKQMPAEASMVSLVDSARMTHMMLGLFKDAAGLVPGFPLGLPELKAPTGKPAYIGLSLVLKAEHGSFDLFIPTAAVTQIRKLLAPILDGDN